MALITPMTSTGDIDVPSLRKLLQYHVESGTDNLCILGTTGEASVMSMKERELILRTAVEEAKGKIPIMAGCGTINPTHIKEMTQQAIDLGCDANLLVTPYYVKPPQRGIIKLFIQIADMGLPVVMYNIPGRASINMEDKSIAICSEHEKIVGLKDATGDLSRVQSIRPMVGEEFLLYSGDDSSSLEFVRQGGDGCISVTANVAASTLHQIMMEALAGNFEKAEELNESLIGLDKKLFCESSPMPVKWAAKRMGMIDTDFCRPPLDVLQDEFKPDLEEALKTAGLI